MERAFSEFFAISWMVPVISSVAEETIWILDEASSIFRVIWLIFSDMAFRASFTLLDFAFISMEPLDMTWERSERPVEERLKAEALPEIFPMMPWSLSMKLLKQLASFPISSLDLMLGRVVRSPSPLARSSRPATILMMGLMNEFAKTMVTGMTRRIHARATMPISLIICHELVLMISSDRREAAMPTKVFPLYKGRAPWI